ncbi:MAG: ribosome assembly protein YhbY [Promethearchaeota archaeon]|nr:MAG: ribosome assembly protein YhbY [Candidatus Lokiarchaeota archaeon]
MDYQEQYKKVLLSAPHCILGKKGITNEFIEHVAKLLKRNKIIKIKALKTIGTKENITLLAKTISESTSSEILDIRGKMIILKKKN